MSPEVIAAMHTSGTAALQACSQRQRRLDRAALFHWGPPHPPIPQNRRLISLEVAMEHWSQLHSCGWRRVQPTRFEQLTSTTRRSAIADNRPLSYQTTRRGPVRIRQGAVT